MCSPTTSTPSSASSRSRPQCRAAGIGRGCLSLTRVPGSNSLARAGSRHTFGWATFLVGLGGRCGAAIGFTGHALEGSGFRLGSLALACHLPLEAVIRGILESRCVFNPELVNGLPPIWVRVVRTGRCSHFAELRRRGSETTLDKWILDADHEFTRIVLIAV